MAAKGSSFPLLKIQEQLTCGKCHNLYTNPKTLSCHHSFCQQCIEGLPTIPTLFVACPTCHQHTELPDHAGPAGFSVAPHLLEFKQIYEEMKKLSGEVKCNNCSNTNAIVDIVKIAPSLSAKNASKCTRNGLLLLSMLYLD